MDTGSLKPSGFLLMELMIATGLLLSLSIGSYLMLSSLYRTAVRPFESGAYVSLLNLARISAMTTLQGSPVQCQPSGMTVLTMGRRFVAASESRNLSFSRPSLTLHPSGSPSYSGKFKWGHNGQQNHVSVGVGLASFFLAD